MTAHNTTENKKTQMLTYLSTSQVAHHVFHHQTHYNLQTHNS